MCGEAGLARLRGNIRRKRLGNAQAVNGSAHDSARVTCALAARVEPRSAETRAVAGIAHGAVGASAFAASSRIPRPKRLEPLVAHNAHRRRAARFDTGHHRLRIGEAVQLAIEQRQRLCKRIGHEPRKAFAQIAPHNTARIRRAH